MIGTMWLSYRFCRNANVSSRFTHIDSSDARVSRTANQSHRISAAPISSCHCCAPDVGRTVPDGELVSPESTGQTIGDLTIRTSVGKEYLGRKHESPRSGSRCECPRNLAYAFLVRIGTRKFKNRNRFKIHGISDLVS